MSDFFFGNTDAQREDIETLREYYTGDPFDILPDISAANASEAPHTLVGLKGAGKTATRRMLEHRIQGIKINIDADHPDFELDTRDFNQRSGRTKNIIKLYLVQFFLEDVRKQQGSPASGLVKKILDKGKEILSKVPEAVDFSWGPVSIDFAKLVAPGAKRYVSAAWKVYKEEIRTEMTRSKGAIFIDDVEDIFVGAESNPSFIEALLRAVTDINAEFGGVLRAYLFLKNGVWKSLSRHPDEFDKVEPYVRFLNWRPQDLPGVIAQRIAVLHPDIEGGTTGVETLWSQQFDWSDSKDFASFSSWICRYSANGPRDLISLCNLAKREAGNDKIKATHLKKVLAKYSDGKLAGLHSEYGHIYNGIREFVEAVFRTRSGKRMKGSELATLIEKNTKMAEADVQKLSEYKWIGDSEKEKLAEILYEVGVIGVKNNDGAVYFIEEPNLPRVSLLENPVEVHAAYRPALGLE